MRSRWKSRIKEVLAEPPLLGKAGGLAGRGRWGVELWAVPMLYTVTSLAAALILPRLEHHFFAGYTHSMSVTSAVAFLSATASGILAFTAIVFSIAFVLVQFSAIAYSPRLVLWFAGRPRIYHALGFFIATFTYSIATLLWTDRRGDGLVPLFSIWLVLALLAASMIVFSRLVQGLAQMQITEVLAFIGDKGRAVIAGQARLLATQRVNIIKGDIAEGEPELGAWTQTLTHMGSPRSVTSIHLDGLSRLAQGAEAVVAVSAAVGDTLVEGDTILRIHGAARPIPERELRRAVRIGTQRTFEQDPKYALRLLADIAIKALSPAINDPTTAVQAIDQINDLLLRLEREELGNLRIADQEGALRVVVPMPSWDDYLALAFDEIRHYGLSSVQVMRRLRAALVGLARAGAATERQASVESYLAHLDRAIARSALDAQDRAAARLPDPQGLGLSRKPPARKSSAANSKRAAASE
jgi:uncharacterized membrane protein